MNYDLESGLRIPYPVFSRLYAQRRLCGGLLVRAALMVFVANGESISRLTYTQTMTVAISMLPFRRYLYFSSDRLITD